MSTRNLKVGVVKWNSLTAYASIGHSIDRGISAFRRFQSQYADPIEIIGDSPDMSVDISAEAMPQCLNVLNDRLNFFEKQQVDAIVVFGDVLVAKISSLLNSRGNSIPVLATAASCLPINSDIKFNFWGPTIHAVSNHAAAITIRKIRERCGRAVILVGDVAKGNLANGGRSYDHEAIDTYCTIIKNVVGIDPLLYSFSEFLEGRFAIRDGDYIYVTGYPDDGYVKVLEMLTTTHRNLTIFADTTFVDEAITEDNRRYSLSEKFPDVLSFDCGLLSRYKKQGGDSDSESRPEYFTKQVLYFLWWAWQQVLCGEQKELSAAIENIRDFKSIEGDSITISSIRQLIVPIVTIGYGNVDKTKDVIPPDKLGFMLQTISDKALGIDLNDISDDYSGDKLSLALNAVVGQFNRTIPSECIMLCEQRIDNDYNAFLMADYYKPRQSSKISLLPTHAEYLAYDSISKMVSFFGTLLYRQEERSILQVSFSHDAIPDNGAFRLYIRQGNEKRVIPLLYALECMQKEEKTENWCEIIIARDDECANLICTGILSVNKEVLGIQISDEKSVAIVLNGLSCLYKRIKSLDGCKAKFLYLFPCVEDVVGDRLQSRYAVFLTEQKLTSFAVNTVAIAVDCVFNRLRFALYRNRLWVANTKSAIGSIMSRNGSHNIGSHVLAALSHNVGTMPDDRVLYQYIQQRMDYIATVTTDFPTWTQPTMFVADMMKTFLSQRHLLDHIVESEGLHAFQFQNPNMTDEEWAAQKNCVKIHVRRKIGEEYKEFIDYTKRDAKVSLQDGTEECDISLAIPGGIIGEHAFYTILENIIRNAAKHSWATGNNNAKNLDVYIDLTDEDEKVKFNVYTSLEASDCSELVDDLDQKLSQSFIDEDTGALRRENWGLAEMKISAGYLAGASIEAIGGIGDKKGTNEIIKPYVKSSKYLGYEFFIAKPKEILIIVKNKNENEWDDQNGVMKKSGIFVKTIKEAKEELKLNYRYIVHYDATEFFDLKTKEPKEGILIPFRMLSGESVSSKSISQADKQNDDKKQDWEWLQPFVADLDDGVEKVENGNGFGQLKEAFENGLVDGVRKIVYKAYYEHLRKSRNDFWSKCDNRNNEYDIKEIGLLVAINENEKAGGNSLISDADILELMLEQNFAVCVDQYKAFAANEDNRKIIKCLESIRHKSSAKDQVIKFKHFSNKTIRELIAQRMCDWAKKLIEKSNDSWNSIVEHLRKKYFVSDVEREPSNELRPSSNKTSDDFEANVNSLLQKHPIDDFIRYVESIFENTKKLFKQYEEQIVTLPAGYKINMLSEVKQEDEGSDKKVALDGVEIVTNIEGAKDKDRHWIGYRRHAHTLPVDASKSLYVEPLSGTQTYLSQLTKVEDNLGLQMRLIENGLMRILVLDERVAKFLREHQKEVGPHYKAMNINVIDHEWVVAGGETPPEGFYGKFTSVHKEALKSFVKPQEPNDGENNQNGNADVSLNSNLTMFDDVDILIVHQGILDKWYPEFKNRKDMGKLLEGFKKLVKYVVVTTGRGTPENIPEEAHLLPFAVVESTLFKKYPEKLILTDTIMNVLPVGKKNDNSGGQE